ncbi:MAG: hypothetical protein LKG25_05990 [Prevotella sp.]|jgi:hypothetical protein|nr:hypothetical protein [Prevotella sp.]MCI1282129.1 hypothetical protein [Prevotella sp.]
MTNNNDPKKPLEEALKHLNDYSDADLEALLKDENADEMALLKRALTAEEQAESKADTNKEWLAFEQKHIAHQRPAWLKVAAIFLGIVLVGSFAFAAIKGLGLLQQQKTGKEIAQKVEKTEKQTAEKLPKDTLKVLSKGAENIHFDNVELQQILSQMALYYKVKVVYANEEVKHVRLFFEWNQAISLDENISVLNGFQKISISRNDNTITIE